MHKTVLLILRNTGNEAVRIASLSERKETVRASNIHTMEKNHTVAQNATSSFTNQINRQLPAQHVTRVL